LEQLRQLQILLRIYALSFARHPRFRAITKTIRSKSLQQKKSQAYHMDSKSLHEVWQAAAGSPFLPTVGKGTQFFVGFVLLLLGISITGIFALS
jgi:hypothetical protein